MDELKERLSDVWHGLQQKVIDSAVNVHRDDILNTYYQLAWSKLRPKELECDSNVAWLCLFAEQDGTYS